VSVVASLSWIKVALVAPVVAASCRLLACLHSFLFDEHYAVAGAAVSMLLANKEKKKETDNNLLDLEELTEQADSIVEVHLCVPEAVAEVEYPSYYSSSNEAVVLAAGVADNDVAVNSALVAVLVGED